MCLCLPPPAVRMTCPTSTHMRMYDVRDACYGCVCETSHTPLPISGPHHERIQSVQEVEKKIRAIIKKMDGWERIDVCFGLDSEQAAVHKIFTILKTKLKNNRRLKGMAGRASQSSESLLGHALWGGTRACWWVGDGAACGRGIDRTSRPST